MVNTHNLNFHIPLTNHPIALKDLSLPPPSSPPRTPIPFFHLLTRLKTTKRAGWERFSIYAGESISDHMYRMSIMTMLAPPALTAQLNIPHCTRMALVHDMAESVVGDITPADDVPKEEKARREAETMEYLCGNLVGAYGGGDAGKGIMELFQEYEEGTTRDSVFVHDVDKVELLLQMVEYERESKGEKDLGEFTWVAKKIQLEEVKEWARDILKEREEFWREVGKEALNLDMRKHI